MKRMTSVFLSSVMALGVVACQEEGPMEKAGRKVDETVEKLRHGDEGTLEKAGRKMDEAIEEKKKEMAKKREESE